MLPTSTLQLHRFRPFSQPALFAFLLVICVLLSISQPVSAQSAPSPVAAAPVVIPFTGAVFSDAGQALPGATVTVQGRNIAPAITNAEGFFILSLPQGTPIRLLVAYPDHAPQVVDLRAPEAEKNLVITLQGLTGSAAKATKVRKTKIKRK